MSQSRQCTVVLLFTMLVLELQCYECDFFKDITVRVTPKRRYPYTIPYEIKGFSRCIEPSAFNETVSNIGIFDQNVTMIGNYAVNNMPELTSLSFSGCKINSISRNAFVNLPKLQHIYLRFGILTRVKKDIFGEIENIEVINLHENNIAEISIHAFGFIPTLKQVIVSSNKLKFFYADWFTNSSNIELLDFSQNYIDNITRNSFKYNPKLKDIFLNFNEIKWIEKGTFENLKSLTFLDLSHNRLTELDPEIIPNKFEVDFFLINANYLNYLSDKFLKKLAAKEITVEGNPWKCPCLDKIHNWMFQSNTSIRITNYCIGSHIPRCFYSSESQLCWETPDKDMTNKYLNTLRALKPPIHEFCAKLKRQNQ